MEVPKDNVLPFAAKASGSSAPSPTDIAMAMAQMHAEGRLFESTPRQVADAGGKDPAPVQIMRSQKSFEQAIKNADGDDDLRSIRDRMKKRGLNINIPEFEGL